MTLFIVMHCLSTKRRSEKDLGYNSKWTNPKCLCLYDGGRFVAAVGEGCKLEAMYAYMMYLLSINVVHTNF